VDVRAHLAFGGSHQVARMPRTLLRLLYCQYGRFDRLRESGDGNE